MMTLLRNNKLLLVILAAAVASAGFWFGILAPKRQEADSLQTKVSAKQGELAQSQQQMATYEKARAAYKANYAKLVALGKAVPADDDVRSLMVELDSAAGDANVEFQKVNVGGSGSGTTAASTTSTTSGAGANGPLAAAPGLVPVGTTGVSALPFSLTFDGTFLNLSDFFSRLDHFVAVRNQQLNVNGRLLRVESFGITPSGSGWPSMTATVGAASYVITPVASPTAGSGSAPAAGGTTPAAGTTPASSGGPSAPPTTTATVPGVAR
jgi:hypothetical protein